MAGYTTSQVLQQFTAGPTDGVFTDGGCIPNPGPGGWGAVYVVNGERITQRHGHDPNTTNNRMEYTAILNAFEMVPDHTPTVVWTDSNLAVRSLTEWAPGWAKRGWKRKTGPVENLDLVKPAYELLVAKPWIELRWVKAHAGNRWNEYADALASAWTRTEV